MSRMTLKWEGARVAARVAAASRVAIDQTLAACVVHAKQHHPWQNVTGTAEGSIQARPATQEGFVIRGTWGSFTVLYFIFLELGTTRMPARPVLRPTADLFYPTLKTRIRVLLAANPV